MFEAKTNMGKGTSAIVAGQVYELEMIYANRTNIDKSRVEISSTETGFTHIITSKQLNEDFVELD